jgi:hypothetical protein
MDKEIKMDGTRKIKCNSKDRKKELTQKRKERHQERGKKEKQTKNGTMIQNVAKFFSGTLESQKGVDCELKAWSKDVFRPVDTQTTGLPFTVYRIRIFDDKGHGTDWQLCEKAATYQTLMVLYRAIKEK